VFSLALLLLGLVGGAGVWGTAPDDVYALGFAGSILRYDGTGWSEMDSGTDETLYSVWGAVSDDVYAVGYAGVVVHYDGTAWETVYAGRGDRTTP